MIGKIRQEKKTPTQSEQKKEKRILKNEDSLSLKGPWDTITCKNIPILGIPEGK